MPFKFRLEPLITIRDNVLKEKQGELAKAYEARRIAVEKLEEIQRDLAGTTEAGREMMQSGRAISVDYLLGLRRHEAYLNAQRDLVQKHIILIDEEIEKRRDAVMEANKELKIVEKLKEKQRERYLAEQARKKTVMMDEVATNGKLKMEN